MSLIAQKQQQIANIKDRFKVILEYDIEKDIIRKEELGTTTNFEILKDSFVAFLSLIRKLDTYDLTTFSLPQLVKFNEDLGQPDAYLKQIKSFNLTGGNPIDRRNRLVSQTEEHIDAFIGSAKEIEIIVEIADPKDKSKELKEAITQVKGIQEKIQKESSEKAKEIDQILESVRSAAGKVGVTSHSNIFKQEAEMHETQAGIWLNRTRNMLIATGGLALLFLIMLFFPSLQISDGSIIQFTISKVVILTILFLGTSICLKNYKAHKHNSIVNKHRQNALNTFETFVSAASADDQTKNAVLLQTTQSIFAIHNTGYNSVENDNDMPGKIIEIVKSSKTN